MEYKMTIAGLERSLPLCKVSDDLYIGAFVIFGDPELTTACAEELLKRAPEYDYMLTAEAKGIPLIHEMARLAGNRKYFLARKKAICGMFSKSAWIPSRQRALRNFILTAAMPSL